MSALDKITKLHGDWQWKDQGAGVAADVEQALPELVTTSPDGQKHVDTSGLVQAVVEAIKELKRHDEELERRVGELERKP